jgi:hypothetical protein
MAGKSNSASSKGGEATQAFRQFSWNLAGTLAGVKAGGKPASSKPGAAKPTAKR